MSFRFVKVCINFCYQQAWKVYDVNQHYWCGANIKLVSVIVSMAYLQKFPKDFISRRGHNRWFWGISSSHLCYADHMQPMLPKCLQILANLYQLRTNVSKGCTETNGIFITSQNFLLLNPFQVNVPFMKKPVIWFLLATCLKNNSRRVTF